MDSRKRLWIYSGLVLAAGVGLVVAVVPSEPERAKIRPQPLVKPGDRILLLGDSLAQGLTTPLKHLAADFGIVFQADGRVGTRIDQWAGWIDGVLKTFSPTVVLISLGTNDMLLSAPLLEKPALDRLVGAVRAAGATIAWILPPAMPFPDRGVRAMLVALGVPSFRSESLAIPRGPDQVHPTVAGYSGWAGAIWRWLASPVALGRFPMVSWPHGRTRIRSPRLTRKPALHRPVR